MIPNLYISLYRKWLEITISIHPFINGWPWGSRHILRDQPRVTLFIQVETSVVSTTSVGPVGIPPPPSGDNTDLRVTELPTKSHRSHGSHVIPEKTR